MIRSPEWRAIAVSATIACVSICALAIDAVVDLNFSGLTKRLESAQASFVDTMAQYQLAFAVPVRAGSSAPAPLEHIRTDGIGKYQLKQPGTHKRLPSFPDSPGS